MKYIFILSFLLTTNCTSKFIVNYSNDKNNTITKVNYIISSELDSLYSIIPDIQAMVNNDSIYKSNFNRYYIKPVFHDLDSLKKYAPVGFTLDPNLGIDLLVFVNPSKSISCFIKVREQTRIVFRFRELFEFFRIPTIYRLYCFRKKQLVAIDIIILP